MNPPNPSSPDPQASGVPPWGRFHWALLGTALLGPPVLTAVAAMAAPRGSAAPALMFLGGIAGGLMIGTMLGCRLGKSTPGKILLSLVLVSVSTVAVVSLCGFGCAVGGYQLNFH